MMKKNKKNKKLPLWSRLRNDHTQPYYSQLQSPHSLDSRCILTIHLLQNHLISLSFSFFCSSFSFSSSSFFFFVFVAEEKLRGFPLRQRAGRGGRERVLVEGFEPRAC
jgi:hypothetical protein